MKRLVIAALALALLAPATARADQAIALLAGNQLQFLDTNAPATATALRGVTGLGAGEVLRGIDHRPSTGVLYGFAVPGGDAEDPIRTYTIDPASGAATFIGQSAPYSVADVPWGVGFDVISDQARVVTSGDENGRINPANGIGTPEFPSDGGLAPDIVGLGFDRSYAGSRGSTAFAIDRNGSRLLRLGGVDGFPSAREGGATAIGGLGVALSQTDDAGFDISGDSRAFAALTTTDGQTRLYAIDLGSGTATSLGVIGPGVWSLALVPGTEQLGPTTRQRPAPPAPPANGAPPDRLAPAALFDLAATARRVRVRSSGLQVLFFATEACRVSATLTGGGVTLARGAATIRRAGPGRVTLRPTTAGRRRLARRGRVRARMQMVLIDAAANAGRATDAIILR